MSNMRRQLKEQNVYFWASRLIEDLAAIRLSPGKAAPAA